MDKSIEERFWGKVSKTEGCWEWTGTKTKRGYGQLEINGATKRAHRVSYEINIGSIPNNILICHRCDNRLCVRPDHLFLGTYADNNQDCQQKGRNSRGKGRWSAVLNEQDVIEIRRCYASGGVTLGELGKRFGVSLSAIWHIANRKTWKHVA